MTKGKIVCLAAIAIAIALLSVSATSSDSADALTEEQTVNVPEILVSIFSISVSDATDSEDYDHISGDVVITSNITYEKTLFVKDGASITFDGGSIDMGGNKLIFEGDASIIKGSSNISITSVDELCLANLSIISADGGDPMDLLSTSSINIGIEIGTDVDFDAGKALIDYSVTVDVTGTTADNFTVMENDEVVAYVGNVGDGSDFSFSIDADLYEFCEYFDDVEFSLDQIYSLMTTFLMDDNHPVPYVNISAFFGYTYMSNTAFTDFRMSTIISESDGIFLDASVGSVASIIERSGMTAFTISGASLTVEFDESFKVYAAAEKIDYGVTTETKTTLDVDSASIEGLELSMDLKQSNLLELVNEYMNQSALENKTFEGCLKALERTNANIGLSVDASVTSIEQTSTLTTYAYSGTNPLDGTIPEGATITSTSVESLAVSEASVNLDFSSEGIVVMKADLSKLDFGNTKLDNTETSVTTSGVTNTTLTYNTYSTVLSMTDVKLDMSAEYDVFCGVLSVILLYQQEGSIIGIVSGDDMNDILDYLDTSQTADLSLDVTGFNLTINNNLSTSKIGYSGNEPVSTNVSTSISNSEYNVENLSASYLHSEGASITLNADKINVADSSSDISYVTSLTDTDHDDDCNATINESLFSVTDVALSIDCNFSSVAGFVKTCITLMSDENRTFDGCMEELSDASADLDLSIDATIGSVNYVNDSIIYSSTTPPEDDEMLPDNTTSRDMNVISVLAKNATVDISFKTDGSATAHVEADTFTLLYGSFVDDISSSSSISMSGLLIDASSNNAAIDGIIAIGMIWNQYTTVKEFVNSSDFTDLVDYFDSDENSSMTISATEMTVRYNSVNGLNSGRSVSLTIANLNFSINDDTEAAMMLRADSLNYSNVSCTVEKNSGKYISSNSSTVVSIEKFGIAIRADQTGFLNMVAKIIVKAIDGDENVSDYIGILTDSNSSIDLTALAMAENISIVTSNAKYSSDDVQIEFGVATPSDDAVTLEEGSSTISVVNAVAIFSTNAENALALTLEADSVSYQSSSDVKSPVESHITELSMTNPSITMVSDYGKALDALLIAILGEYQKDDGNVDIESLITLLNFFSEDSETAIYLHFDYLSVSNTATSEGETTRYVISAGNPTISNDDASNANVYVGLTMKITAENNSIKAVVNVVVGCDEKSAISYNTGDDGSSFVLEGLNVACVATGDFNIVTILMSSDIAGAILNSISLDNIAAYADVVAWTYGETLVVIDKANVLMEHAAVSDILENKMTFTTAFGSLFAYTEAAVSPEDNMIMATVYNGVISSTAGVISITGESIDLLSKVNGVEYDTVIADPSETYLFNNVYIGYDKVEYNSATPNVTVIDSSITGDIYNGCHYPAGTTITLSSSDEDIKGWTVTDGNWVTFVTNGGTYVLKSENVSIEAEAAAVYNISWTCDGTVIGNSVAAAGEVPVYHGDTPTRSPTVQYSYTFSGWEGGVTAASADAEYKAVFTSALNTYTVSITASGGKIAEGGWVLVGDTYTKEFAYGTTVTLPVLTKESGPRYDYTFVAWDTASVTISGDVSLVAHFSKSVRTYTVTIDPNGGTTDDTAWTLNADGTYTASFEYGTLADLPTFKKASAVEYVYTFTEWDPAKINVTADVQVKAEYSQANRAYEVSINANGGTTAEDGWTQNGDVYSKTFEYGATVTLPVFTKVSTALMKFEFVAWDESTSPLTVSGDAEFDVKWSNTLIVSPLVRPDGSGDIELPASDNENLNIPKADLGKLSDMVSGESKVFVNLDTGRIALSDAAVNKFSAATTDVMSITMTTSTGTSDETLLGGLTDEQKSAIGNSTIVSISVTGAGDDMTGLGTVKITVPYTLKEGEHSTDVVIYYLSSAGIEAMNSGYYEVDGVGYAWFETSHFSDFVISNGSLDKEDHTLFSCLLVLVGVIECLVIVFIARRH